MSSLQSSLAVLACLSLSIGCSDESMGEASIAADGAIASAADASPVSPPDASAPIATDAAVETPEDFPIELACTLDDVQPILECATDHCLDSIADGTMLTCMTFSCGLLLLTLPPDCSQCLLTGLADPSSALDACVLGLDDLGGGFPLPPAP